MKPEMPKPAMVLVDYRTLPGQTDAARLALGELVAKVQALEPDCHGIRLVQDPTDPTRITLIERWSSADVFRGPHMQQPHMQAFIQSAGAFLTGPPDISFWHEAERPG